MKLFTKIVLSLFVCCIAVVMILKLMPKERLLLSAVNEQNMNMVDWMLKLGADPNVHTDSAYTPLNLAVRNGDLNMIRKLLAHGASPNEQANYGSGEKILVGNLSIAINYVVDPVPVIQLLIEAGINVADDPYALKDAIERGQIKAVELLIRHGADINGGLQFAIMYDKLDIVRLMLESGADPNQGVMLAKMTYNQEALLMLEEAGATVTSPPREQTHPEDYTTVNGAKIRLH
ncbi:ankyrin repeat domain-containing protein [Paenibacillus thailandensis]